MRKVQDKPWAVDPPQRPSVRLIKGLGRFYARAFHRLDVLSPCRLPPTGPAILVCNHISGLDPVLIQSVCPRLVVWMMAREYYDLPAMRWGFELIEAIPVERSGKDLAATRAALRALNRGRVLGVFPEGRIETDSDLLPFQTGVAMLAQRAGADVYPSYLDGTQRGKEMLQCFMEPQSARLVFGDRIVMRSEGLKPDFDAATAQVRSRVEALRGRVASLAKRGASRNSPPGVGSIKSH